MQTIPQTPERQVLPQGPGSSKTSYFIFATKLCDQITNQTAQSPVWWKTNCKTQCESCVFTSHINITATITNCNTHCPGLQSVSGGFLPLWHVESIAIGAVSVTTHIIQVILCFSGRISETIKIITFPLMIEFISFTKDAVKHKKIFQIVISSNKLKPMHLPRNWGDVTQLKLHYFIRKDYNLS